MLGLICDVPLVQSFPGLAVESEDQSKFKVDAEILRDSGIPLKKKNICPGPLNVWSIYLHLP